MRRTQDTSSPQPEPKTEVTANRTIKASEIYYIPHFSPKRKSSSVRAITQRKPALIRGACNLAYQSFRDLFSL